LAYDSTTETFVLLRPKIQDNAIGIISLDDDEKKEFVLVYPTMDIVKINAHLKEGSNLVFLPGQYYYSSPIIVTKPNTMILGLGYATINPTQGNIALRVNDAAFGVRLCGLMIEAGNIRSDSLVVIGDEEGGAGGLATEPTILYDIFPRVGGPTENAAAATMMTINQKYCTVMHTWMWRSDHTETVRSGLGVDKAQCDHALIVNGDGVRFFGLFVEHTLKEGIVWNGNQGAIHFLQSEFAYDVVYPWNYPMIRVTGSGFTGNNLGIYSYFANKFHQGSTKAPSVMSAILTDNTDATINYACTVFLDASTDKISGGAGSIQYVWNTLGHNSNVENADVAQWVIKSLEVCS
jgi:hypothetical protein